SECPCKPWVCGIRTPPMMRSRPSTSACTSKPWPIRRFIVCSCKQCKAWAESGLTQQPFDDVKVFGPRDLQISDRSGHQQWVVSGQFHGRGLVGDRGKRRRRLKG